MFFATCFCMVFEEMLLHIYFFTVEKQFIHTKDRKRMFYWFVHSFFVYGNSNSSQTKIIFTPKMTESPFAPNGNISWKKFDSTDYIFREHKLLKFEYIYRFFTLLTLYKSVRNSPCDHFTICNNDRQLRSTAVNMVCPAFRTTLYKNSIFNYGPSLFIKLPQSIKIMFHSAPLSIFKSSVRKYLLTLQNCI